MRLTKKSRRRRRRAGLITGRAGGPAVLTAAAAVAAAIGFLKRRHGDTDPITNAREDAAGEQPAGETRAANGTAGAAKDAEPAAREEWSCECGQEYRVSGAGRHRVYWLADADESDPVLSDTCPSCDRGLPGKGVEAADS